MAGGLAVQIPQFASPGTQTSENCPREQVASFPTVQQVKTIDEFKKLHAQYIKLGLDCVPRNAGNLLLACAVSEWGSIEYATAIFIELESPGTFDFNTMIRGSIQHNDQEAALLFYKQMLESYVSQDNFTFPFALKACSHLSAIEEGLQIHAQAVKHGFDCDVYVQNSLISMYGKCGEIKSSYRIFEHMGCNRTAASWSAILASHTRMGLWSRCLELFEEITREGRRPDESSMVSALSSCKHMGAYDLGRSIHCSLLKNIGKLNVIVQTSLIDMYINCGCLEKGLMIFDAVPEKNVWTYSVMISGLAMHGEGEGALEVFSDMLEEGLEPDEAIYVGVLTACSHAGMLEEGLRCFDRMRFEHQIVPTPQHYGCMVDLMSRAGKLKEAYELIKSMPNEPTDVAWRSLLSACKTYEELDLAEYASRNLMRLNAHNSGDYINISSIYAKAKRWKDAATTRTEIVNTGILQVPGFSRVEIMGKMHTFVSHDKSHPQSNEVYEMLYQMEWQLHFEGYIPDTSDVLADVEEEEKKQMLSAHSQKLAIAFALLNTKQGAPIRIITNLRMSKDCHTFTALISTIFNRKIAVRDRNRFHKFTEGVCACMGFW